MEKEKEQKIIFAIVAVVCIVLFAFAISPKTLQNDTYYTIKIGEYIYQNGISNLTEDVFSWHELPYTYPHWLYDLGIFLIYNFFGHAGIYASTIILASILGLVIYMLCSKFSKNNIVSLIITIGAMYLLEPYIAARAQLLTFILFGLTVYSIEMFLETHKKRYALYLIIIPLIIANVHCAVFPFYFVLYLPYIAEFLWISFIDLNLDKRIQKLFIKVLLKICKRPKLKEKLQVKYEAIPNEIIEINEKRKKLREKPYRIKVTKNFFVIPLIFVMLIAACTGILNPAGDGAYTYLYKTMQGNTTDSINEHQPMVLVNCEEFMFVLLIFLAILIFTDTKIKLSDLFMLVGLTYLSFRTKRQISMFAIFCAPILAKLVAAMFDKYDQETCKKLMNFAGSCLGACVIILTFALVSIDMLKDIIDDPYVDSSTYPVSASDWIIENLDYKNIKLYNEYNYGSYLLFRGIPVFIDSRADLYAPEFNGNPKKNIQGRDIFSDALNIAGIAYNYKDAFETYGVTHVISYSDSKLVMLLSDDSDYKKLYDDDRFTIFERAVSDKEI
ncbi:MAG: hypothetical protein J6A36_01620 [Clostridia bacterium]|nr:hypothetical protein [Clostridia bacterium]